MIRLNTRYLVFGLVMVFAASVAVQFFAIQLPEGKNPSNVTIAVNYGSRIVAYSVEAVSAFGALNRTHAVEYRNYANGHFVTSVDSVTENVTHSWGYFVNGQLPMMSADSYTVKNGDNITFMLMENEKFYEYFGK